MNMNVLSHIPEGPERDQFLERLQLFSQAGAEAQARAERFARENEKLRQRLAAAEKLKAAESASHGAAKYQAQLLQYQRQDVLRTLMNGVTDSEFKEIQKALGQLQGGGKKS